MKSVLYLCRGPKEPDALFFAPELEEGYFVPGMFVIEASDGEGHLAESYEFKARQGDRELDLVLKSLSGGRTYEVDAGNHGKFYFTAVALSRRTKYSGRWKGNSKRLPFFRLDPVSMQMLEQACRARDFYFTGSSGTP